MCFLFFNASDIVQSSKKIREVLVGHPVRLLSKLQTPVCVCMCLWQTVC